MIVASNTGPLISAFQSESVPLLLELFDEIHIPKGVLAELTAHGWSREVRAIPGLIIAELTASEMIVIRQVAAEIATLSGDASPSALHAGEAEAIVLAERGTPKFDVVLLDERAARQVAESRGLTISGFPGTLLMAVESRLITPDQLKQRLEDCIRQGTHYGTRFVHSVYREALRRWSST